MDENPDQQGHNWFVRSNGKVTGPFPAGLVSRYLLIGRIKFSDEVSADRHVWLPVKRVRGLIPEALLDAVRNPTDPAAQERLKAARRWADERLDDRPRQEGRSPEEKAELRHREAMAQRQHKRRHHNRLLQSLVVVVLVSAVTGGILLIPTPDEVAEADCSVAAAPGVIWRNCLLPGGDLANSNLEGADLRNSVLRGSSLRAARLVGSDLAYADLSGSNLRGADLTGANLKGINLRGSDLTRARLVNSDLSYADLTGADIGNTDLTGARLDHAVLGNGYTCMPGSVGSCQLARPGG